MLPGVISGARGVYVLRRRDGRGFAQAVLWDGGNVTAVRRLVPEAERWPRPGITHLVLPEWTTPGRRHGTGRIPGLVIPGEWVVCDGAARVRTQQQVDRDYEPA